MGLEELNILFISDLLGAGGRAGRSRYEFFGLVWSESG